MSPLLKEYKPRQAFRKKKRNYQGNYRIRKPNDLLSPPTHVDNCPCLVHAALSTKVLHIIMNVVSARTILAAP